ncbi:MAG TPA: copper chaperone PCu(A)C [Streptomyces sp.]|nr:copper chaperone PCu(A)C [Streptomyces sp.]
MNTRTGDSFMDVVVRLLRSAVVPLVTCLATLGALTAWTATGNAGEPRGLKVSQGRVFTPLHEGATAAFFTIRNTGQVNERLTGVRAVDAEGTRTMLSRNITTGGNARSMMMLPDISIPAGSTLRMSPYALNIMITPAPKIAPGDRIRFTLYFADRAPITGQALAVRPGELK